MIELTRIVEYQATLSSYRATQNEERAIQLELLVEATKPKKLYGDWHPLIATPFRYKPPHPNARFRPMYGRNVFYGSVIEETALYEHAYYFIRERLHLEIKTETGVRTLFFVDADDSKAIKIHHDQNVDALTNKNDYSASQQFLMLNPRATFILYPSCRDPKRRDNAAILDIEHLAKNPKWEASIRYFYDSQKKQLTWIDYPLHIQWGQVA